ncbi:cell wall hydrolase [Ferviditalea candida]|uniref:Cell wall hydrolase n=1 Tax=Ferviditalea candida TaxID=3108399 RepID=A0ABU5ZED6_9BACL|nr:cell wall hydrolase [Paenibacillaceae bacterium T2]
MGEIRGIAALLTLILLMMAFPQVGKAADNPEQAHIFIEGKEIPGNNSSAYMWDNRLYVPLRFITDRLGGEASWDGENNQVRLRTSQGDDIIFTADAWKIKYNGKQYLTDTPIRIKDDATYLPLRYIAEFLHCTVIWDGEQRAAFFQKVPLYNVQSGDSLKSISEALHLPEGQLKETNGLQDDSLQAGQTLKIVIPSIIKNKDGMQDFYLLAQLIDAEAGYEPYKGQIAVGDVVINRVQDSRFPNSIREVVYASGQFTPAMNGTLETIEPKPSALKAAAEVMQGVNIVEGALYFYNPGVNSGGFFASRQFIAQIGSHRFVK